MTLKNDLEKIEVLSDIYNKLAEQDYPDKQELEVARLKMELLKKEILLVNYSMHKEIEDITC